MKGFLEGGFIDTFRYFHPNEKERYSWWHFFNNLRAANCGWRIDHICVSRGLEKRLKDAVNFRRTNGQRSLPGDFGDRFVKWLGLLVLLGIGGATAHAQPVCAKSYITLRKNRVARFRGRL